MHRCLWIPDIIATIIEEIALQKYTRREPSSRSTLAKLAQTCRMLSELSLNSLWKVQSSLVPLLRTMPSDLWEQRDEELHIRRPIKPEDWARFHIYARRIHHFIPRSDSPRMAIMAKPTPECFEALACSKPREMISLCPQVRSLSWVSLAQLEHSEHLISFKYMPLFMGAYTTKLVVRLDTLEPAELSIIKSILSVFPSIRDLSIENVSTELDEEALSECLSHGQSLQAVSISDELPHAAVEHLAGFQHLKRLKLTIEHGVFSPRLSGFCALEEVDVTGSSFPMVSMVMNMLNSQSPLRDITLYARKEDTVVDVRGLSHTFDTIGLRCSALHLQSLPVDACYWGESNSPPPFIDETAFKPLLQFRNLSSLNLAITTPFRVGNRAVQDMVSAWPQLTCLILGMVGWSGGSSITPAGLVHLLRLPHLRTLSIAIDVSAMDVDLVSGSTNTLPKNTNICDLYLQDSVIYDVKPMAKLLSIVAPNIKYINAWEDVVSKGDVSEELYEAYQDRWCEVMALMQDSWCLDDV
ncbi:hypothetical protein FIBSPDRAFT_461985 [Athelia psychrophila]|uniref:F-box domain-containing protein n=1 Tax=Athelia psychrophila TaxID=1759441 RepID=A0A166LWT4_9AGAM|nr:hypothetical protein FIBSPDRAFT_461985 [Fibularhizoctonia sp. CBS 109695]